MSSSFPCGNICILLHEITHGNALRYTKQERSEEAVEKQFDGDGKDGGHAGLCKLPCVFPATEHKGLKTEHYGQVKLQHRNGNLNSQQTVAAKNDKHEEQCRDN